jgi:DNA-binding transcriptional ArsR family regulator
MQGEILAALLLQPDREFTMSELSALTGSAPSQVHGEVSRLTAAGWTLDRRVGRSRLIRAATEHSMYKPMVQILELSYGPLVVLPEILAHVGQVREAYIYGSWAARYVGEAGSAPRDLDVLLVGSPSRREMTEAASDASARLGLEVNISRVETSAWEQETDGFVATLKSRPHVAVAINATTPDGQE